MTTKAKPPRPLVLDEDTFVCQCLRDGRKPYVDIRLDTIPVSSADRDFSEDPETLRRLAAWLSEAADWLESQR